mmetsp:Transcript_22997/g.45940  ORF Transcript_22997/g.45940 Transcript_22997/m.45940 type:complete len:165 (+) Transcript_22997:319-813(+)
MRTGSGHGREDSPRRRTPLHHGGRATQGHGDHVVVGPDAVQYRWESEAGSSYTVAEDTSEPIEGSGTRLILKLKEDSLEYLEAGKLTDLLQRYSSFIEFPISVFKSTTREGWRAAPLTSNRVGCGRCRRRRSTSAAESRRRCGGRKRGGWGRGAAPPAASRGCC